MEEIPKDIKLLRCTLKKSESVAKKIYANLKYMALGIIAIIAAYVISLTNFGKIIVDGILYALGIVGYGIVWVLKSTPFDLMFKTIDYIASVVPWYVLYPIEIVIAFFLYSMLWCMHRDTKDMRFKKGRSLKHAYATVFLLIGFIFIGLFLGLLNALMLIGNISFMLNDATITLRNIITLVMVIVLYTSVILGAATGWLTSLYIYKWRFLNETTTAQK
jgi:hypothetical protein